MSVQQQHPEQDLSAVDFETEPVGFFDRGAASKSNANGHPRLAIPLLVSWSGNSGSGAATLPLSAVSAVPLGQVVVFHNAAFDLPIARRLFGFECLAGRTVHCTRTMAKLAKNNRSAGLKDLASELLGKASLIRYQEAAAKGGAEFVEYAINDARLTKALFPVLMEDIQAKALWHLYSEVELPFIFLNLECQENGLAIALNRLASLDAQIRVDISQLKEKISPETNFQSPRQVQELLFGRYQLPVTQLKGRVSTSKSALQKLADVPIVADLLRLKALEGELRQIKQISRFIHPETRAVHPYIDTLGADTGRCTSQKPNLQNISRGTRLRELFISRPGMALLVFDFGQIEPRTLAHFLGDGDFRRSILEGGDIYTKLGHLAFSSGGSDVPARDVAKLVLLATMYGSGDKTLAEQLKLSPRDAKAIRARFFAAFPEIVRYQREAVQFARQNGFIVGLLGRRRYIDNLHSADDFERARAERQVLNAIIQGSAATLFKYKLVELRKELPRSVRFLHHIHDEVVLEVPGGEAEKWLSAAREILVRPVDWFSIPLVVEGGVGVSWADAKKSGKEVKNEIAKSGSLSDRERLETQGQGERHSGR